MNMKNQYDEEKYDRFFQQVNHSISWKESSKQTLFARLEADISSKHCLKKRMQRFVYGSSIAVFIICLFLGGTLTFERFVDRFSQSLGQGGGLVGDEIQEWDAAEIEKLAKVWANALKSRDGKQRFSIMSNKAKEKFKLEQSNQSGKEWNYTIGVSSPWVVDFEIKIKKGTATIIYLTETSEPAFYERQETIVFIYEDGQLVVNDYRIDFEDRLLED